MPVADPVTKAVEEAYKQLKADILKGRVNVVSPSSLIARGTEIMGTFQALSGPQKKDALIQVVRRLAAGVDGVEGTADDLIPPVALRGLLTMLDQNLMGDVIDLIAGLKGGNVDMAKAQAVGTKVVGCFGPLRAVFGSLASCFRRAPPAPMSVKA